MHGGEARVIVSRRVSGEVPTVMMRDNTPQKGTCDSDINSDDTPRELCSARRRSSIARGIELHVQQNHTTVNQTEMSDDDTVSTQNNDDDV